MSPGSVKAAFTAAAEHFGKDFHLDVCVNNAGYSLSGDTEAAKEQETHDEIETLFFGTARVTMRAVENMRQSQEHRGGLIFNISSLAGVCAFPGHAYYHAGKFAVEGWTESVAREMHKEWNSKSTVSHSSRRGPSTKKSICSPLLHHRARWCQDQLRWPQQSPYRASPSLRRQGYACPHT